MGCLPRISSQSCLEAMLAGKAADRAKVVCQTCLAPGHWTYECKAGPTYQVRASRTRQLKQKRLRQPFLEEEAPEIPLNPFLFDDKQREPETRPADILPLSKKVKREKSKKKKKKDADESSSSSSSESESSDSSSSSSSS